jgi:hypothetical protein
MTAGGGQLRADLTEPAAAPVVLEGVEAVQLVFEQAGVHGHPLVPAGLVPTLPTLVTLLVVRANGGELGPFQYAQVRLSCRSGARARSLVIGQVVDADAATAATLEARWGLAPAQRGSIRMDRGYAITTVSTPLFVAAVRDPEPIGGDVVQFVCGLHPVTIGGEERLAQVELDVHPQRAERGRPSLEWFPERDDLRPVRPVAGVVALGTMTLPAVRFVLDPDLPPHLGTRSLAASRSATS